MCLALVFLHCVKVPPPARAPLYVGSERTIVLDVAGGTGDIAFRIMDVMRASLERPAERPHVIVCDINPAMLGVGRQRAQYLGYESE